MYSALSEIYEYANAQLGSLTTDRKSTNTNKNKQFCLPVFIAVDKEGQEIRQNLLWRLGGDQQAPRQIANKLCAELQLQSNIHDKLIEDQINVGTKHMRDWSKEDGGIQAKMINLYVKGGDEGVAFVDEVYWEFGKPQNSAENYASIVCMQLGLGVTWFDRIVRVLGLQIRYHKLDAELQSEEVTGDNKKQRTDESKNLKRGMSNNPRLQIYNAENDDYEEISKKYQQLVLLKAKKSKTAQAAAAVQPRTQIVYLKEESKQPEINVKQEPSQKDVKSEPQNSEKSNAQQQQQQQPVSVSKQVLNTLYQQQKQQQPNQQLQNPVQRHMQQVGQKQGVNPQYQQQLVHQQQQQIVQSQITNKTQQTVVQQQQQVQLSGQKQQQVLNNQQLSQNQPIQQVQQFQQMQQQQQQMQKQQLLNNQQAQYQQLKQQKLQQQQKQQVTNNQQMQQQGIQQVKQQTVQQIKQQVVQKQQVSNNQQQQVHQIINTQQQQSVQQSIASNEVEVFPSVGASSGVQLQPKLLAAPPIAGVAQRVIKLEHSNVAQQQVMMNLGQQQGNKVNPIMSGGVFGVQHVVRPTQQWPIPIQTGGEGSQLSGAQPQAVKQFLQAGTVMGGTNTPLVVPPPQQQQQSSQQKVQQLQQATQKQQPSQQASMSEQQQLQQQQQQALSQREVQAVLMRALRQKGATNTSQPQQ